jgi:regulator of sirC expression with transglutaminase-like and TPR domain
MFYFCSDRKGLQKPMPEAAALARPAEPRCVAECPVTLVDALLDRPEAELDYAEAKLAVDRFIEPSFDAEAVGAELDGLTDRARLLSAGQTGTDARLGAVRTVLYEAGPWNGGRPFAYDHQRFKDMRVKLLAHYLDTRLGNCVSMPILFLILADRLGVEMRLAMAPNHVLLRYRDEFGREINLEATGTGLPSRDVWYRQIMPMTDRAVQSGIYLRLLTRRESVALIAAVIVEHLQARERFEETIAACRALLPHHSRSVYLLLNLGVACQNIIRRDYLRVYGSELLIPLSQRPRYAGLYSRMRAAFAAADALGWLPNGEERN